jgi:hypothetical protein
MAGDLKLSLNTESGSVKDRSGLLAVLIIIAIVLVAIDIALHLTGFGGAGSEANPAELERIALKLEKQELYGPAASAWAEYLEAASPGDGERAGIWYRIGRMREREGDCESALAAYYRSEQAAAVPELEQEISMGVERCLTRLSKFSALRSELDSRTSFGAGDGGGEGAVVAEIGTEKITREMLEAMIEAEVDAQVDQAAAGLPPDQVRARREEILEDVMERADLGQWLERLVAEELLFRYAMEEKIQEDPQVAEMSRRMERKLLASRVLAREYEKSVSVSEDEMREWYDANSARIADSAGTGDGGPPPYDEVKDKVYAAVRLEKEMAVQEALLDRLMDRYDVVIHSSKLGGEPEEKQR